MTLREFFTAIHELGHSNQEVKDLTTDYVVTVKDVLEDYPQYILDAPVRYGSYYVSHERGRALFSFSF